jgi:hypothetical protein
MKINQINKEEIRQEAQKFFHSQKWKNFLIFVIFVALVTCFWILQYLQQRIEREISVQIQYTHLPNEVILNDSLPDKLTIKLADKGSVFVRYFFENTLSEFNIDLTNLSSNKSSFKIDKEMLNAQIREMLLNSTQILSTQPEVIVVKYSPLRKKEAPVRINGKINTANGYIFKDGIHITPSSVFVYGEEKLIDSIRYISTETIQIENINKNLDKTLGLLVPKGAHLSTKEVKITAEAEEYTEKVFELSAVCYDYPKDVHIRFFPSSVDVVCQLTMTEYSQLKKSDLKVGVNYNELIQNQGTKTSLVLLQKPQWLMHYRILPEIVEYLIESKRDV